MFALSNSKNNSSFHFDCRIGTLAQTGKNLKKKNLKNDKSNGRRISRCGVKD